VPDTDHPPSPHGPALAAWIRLEQTAGVGGATLRRLLARFGSAPAIFEAGYPALCEVLKAPLAQALCAPLPDAIARQTERVAEWLTAPANHLLTLGDAGYPALLAQIPDAPPLLYLVGRPALLHAPALAVVGSRNASAQGCANAELFAHALSLAGLTIVSGLALGIDAAAHEGGLAGPGSTVAVLGTGADRIYPACHGPLARRIGAEGCLLTEYALGTPPAPANFPRRNRIISGLASGVLVVEAAARSGSLITARLAAEQGRDVFALPGSIHAALSKGCHALIRDGAQLVESAADVLGPLRSSPLTALARAPQAPSAHPRLLAALGPGPLDAERLATLMACAPGLLAAQLLALELGGQVERLPGGLFQCVNR
jgi:DNA processing protein